MAVLNPSAADNLWERKVGNCRHNTADDTKSRLCRLFFTPTGVMFAFSMYVKHKHIISFNTVSVAIISDAYGKNLRKIKISLDIAPQV